MNALIISILGLNGFAFSGLFIAVTTAVMAVFMFVLARNRANVLWGIFCIAVFMWGLGAYRIGSGDPASALAWWRIAYFGVILIPVVFVHFVYALLGIRRYILLGVLYGISALYLIANFTHRLILGTHRILDLQFLTPTPLYNSFVIFFFLLVIYAHVLLFRAYLQAQGQQRIQIAYFMAGSLVGFIGGSFSFLPEYSISIYPYPNVAVALFPIIMGYAALRHQLFDMRVVIAEILTSVLWIFVAFRTVLGWGTAQTPLDLMLLAIVIVLGILLVRSVAREVAQRDQLKELNHIQAQYFSFATHQVKAPMIAIRGFATLISDGDYGPVSDTVKEVVGKIKNAADRMIQLVNNILNARRIEEGKMEYEFKQVPVEPVIQSVVEEFRPLALQKNIQLTFESTAPQAAARMDEQYFRQALQNLIENALKYTDAGVVKVHLEHGGSDLVITVADTGRGMSHETLSHLFSEFGQGEHMRAVSGTGLGLFIARDIVQAHKGTLKADSKGEGMGSTFTITIPAAVIP